MDHGQVEALLYWKEHKHFDLLKEEHAATANVSEADKVHLSQ